MWISQWISNCAGRCSPTDGEAAAGRRLGRPERIVLLTEELLRAPGQLLSLSQFVTATGAAKSTISEDLSLIDRVLQQRGVGEVSSVAGAAGGVIFHPLFPPAHRRDLATRLCADLADPERQIPGGYLFTSDLVFSPQVATEVGALFAVEFAPRHPEVVVTVETKGIPLALMTARALGVPLVTARRDSRVTEGSAIGLNYVSASSRIATMSLPRRVLAPGTRALLVDDFLKGGGTALGMTNLMREFGCTVVGTAVLIETEQPTEKLVDGYFAVLRLSGRAEGSPHVDPSPRLGGMRS